MFPTFAAPFEFYFVSKFSTVVRAFYALLAETNEANLTQDSGQACLRDPITESPAQALSAVVETPVGMDDYLSVHRHQALCQAHYVLLRNGLRTVAPLRHRAGVQAPF